MATRSEIDRSRDYVRTLIDYGSGRLKICVQPIRPGSFRGWDILDVTFDGNNKELEQVLIKDDVEGLIAGTIATDSWHRQNQCPDASISLWKLYLSPEYRDSDFARQAYNAIGATQDEPAAIEELIQEHLKLIRHKIEAFLRNQPFALHCGHHDEAGCKCHLDNLQFETTITIPVAWNPEARGIMIDAARNAGFSNIRLQYEPVCAAAADLPRFRRNRDIQDEDRICCADGGHGTMDVVTVHTKASSSHPDGFDIDVVGEPTGDLAGAHMVEQAAFRYMETQCPEVKYYEDLSTLCAELGISVDDLRRQIYEQVACIKEQDPIQDKPLLVSGIARTSNEPGISRLYVHISRDNMTSFIMEWAKAAYKTLSDHLKKPGNKCRAVLLSGGISKCRLAIDFIKEQLQNDFQIKNLWTSYSDNPVARGGLRRYPRNEPDELPEGSLFLIRDEPWQPNDKKHTKGTIWISRYRDEGDGRIYAGNDIHTGHFPQAAFDLAGKKDIQGNPYHGRAKPKTMKKTAEDPLPDPRWVKRCPKSGLLVAEDRLVSVMDRSSANVAVNPSAWTALVDPKMPARLRFKMYHSRPGQKIAQNSPLRDAKKNIRRGLVTWPTKYIAMPDLAQHGFTEITMSDGGAFYECRCIVHTEAAPGSLILCVKVLKPGEDYQYEYDERTKTEKLNLDYDYPLAFTLTKEIWGTYATHVISDTTFQVGDPPRNPKKRLGATDVTGGQPAAKARKSSRLRTTGGPSFVAINATTTNKEEHLYNSTPLPRGSFPSSGVDMREDRAAGGRIMRIVDGI